MPASFGSTGNMVLNSTPLRVPHSNAQGCPDATRDPGTASSAAMSADTPDGTPDGTPAKPGDLRPFALLLERGNCNFTEKVLWAQGQGAAAAVVFETFRARTTAGE